MASLFRPPESTRSNSKTPKLRLPTMINDTASLDPNSASFQSVNMNTPLKLQSSSPASSNINTGLAQMKLNNPSPNNMYNANAINSSKSNPNNNTQIYNNTSKNNTSKNNNNANLYNANMINNNSSLNGNSVNKLTPLLSSNTPSPYGRSPISKSPASLKKRPPPPSLPSLSLNQSPMSSTSSLNKKPPPILTSDDDINNSNHISSTNVCNNGKNNSGSNIISSMNSLTLNTELTSNTSIEDTPIEIINSTINMIYTDNGTSSSNGVDNDGNNGITKNNIPYLRKELNESSDSYFSNIISTYENNSSNINSPLKTPLSGSLVSDQSIDLSTILSGRDVDQLDETFWQYKSIKNEIITLGILGEGAGGSVAKCKLKTGSKIFALKTINTLNTEPEFQKQIFRELQFNKSFKSNYIVRYYGMFNDELNSSIYIAMEYMGGRSLEAVYKNLLQRGGRIGEKVLGKIAEDVLKGLSYLHEMKVIHRDIKPQNILFNEEGEVKLCDFGVSGEAVNSLATTFTGTSFYMAPERIQGEPYSVTCDVWSLGLTILEVAQGQFPFGSDKITANIAPIELLVLILTFAPELKDEPENNIIWSKSFKSFIEYCLKKDPRERPSPRQMLKHPWVQGQMKKQVNMTKFIKKCWEA